MNIELSNARYLLLATRKKSGAMVNTPVWFATDEQYHYVFSATDTGKVKRLRNFPDVNISSCTASGKALGEPIATTAALINDSSVVEHAHKLLLNKYGWQMRGLDFFSRLLGKYNQRAFIRIDISTDTSA